MSGKYLAGRVAFATDLHWVRDPIVAQLVGRDYVFDARHQDVRALKALVGSPAAIEGKSVSDTGWVRSAALMFREVVGPEVVAIVIRRESGVLLAHLDGIARFPMKPNGGDIRVDVPVQGLFRI